MPGQPPGGREAKNEAKEAKEVHSILPTRWFDKGRMTVTCLTEPVKLKASTTQRLFNLLWPQG